MSMRSFLPILCLILISIIQVSAQCDPVPPEPEIACYETATLNEDTCEWEVEGEMPPEPPIQCYETVEWSEEDCDWLVDGEPCRCSPDIECYEIATWNDITCQWDVSGEMPPEPVVECYESPIFDDVWCVWLVNSDLPVEPQVECYETATFDDVQCMWIIEGELPPEPVIECYETATFNEVMCKWEVEGEMPIEPGLECYETATFDDALCAWVVSGIQPEEPESDCWEYIYIASDTFCDYQPVGISEPIPIPRCFDNLIIDEANCEWEFQEGTMPEEPIVECYETAVFNNTACMWEVEGEMPEEPECLCSNQVATYNNIICQWEVVITIPEPSTECYQTATFSSLSCSWQVSGQKPPEPSTVCWEIAEFNDTSCLWEINGVMPTNPYPGCFVFNEDDCLWQPEGIPNINDIQDCNQTLNILDDCTWEITGVGMCNFVTGIITLDPDLDGCGLNDPSVENANIHNAFYSTFSSATGRYSLHTDLDSMIIGIDPTRCDIIYPPDTVIYFDDSNVQTLDFCLPSLPITDASLILCPGPDYPNGYFVMINNFGAIPISGEVTLQAEHTIIDSSMPPVTSEMDNIFTWEFEEIEPYGKMRIDFILSFDESIMIGDQVIMTSTVSIDQEDKDLSNNQRVKTKTVSSVSSNLNTTALIQGSPLPPSAIGEYVDLVIVFENEESRSFTNSIVLRDTLNTDFFDVTTFEPLIYSHDCTVDLCDGNKLSVEFDDNVPNGEDGFFAYRIRLSDNLQVGDTITSQASIYIDFNPPILADPAIAVIGINEIMLALDDVSFSSTYDAINDQVNLHWIANNENNIDHYTVERAIGSSTFKSIESLDAIGESHYTAVDDDLQSGVHYYRLKVDRYTGETDYSDIISINLEDERTLEFTITPNPTRDQFTLTLDSTDSVSSIITIYNDQGQLMTTRNTEQSEVSFDSSQYPAGVYIVKVQVGDQVVSRKLVVM